MSKTGGGRGTNQHKIKGTSQAKKTTGTTGESQVSLGVSEDFKPLCGHSRSTAMLPPESTGEYLHEDVEYFLKDRLGVDPQTVNIEGFTDELYETKHTDLGIRYDIRNQFHERDALESAIAKHRTTDNPRLTLQPAQRRRLDDDSAEKGRWHYSEEALCAQDLVRHLGDISAANQQYQKLTDEDEKRFVASTARHHNAHVAARIGHEAPINAVVAEVSTEKGKVAAFYNRDGKHIDNEVSDMWADTVSIPEAGVDRLPEHVLCQPSGIEGEADSKFIDLNAARELSDTLLTERRAGGADAPEPRSDEVRWLQLRSAASISVPVNTG
ncbi:hypothetical protein [Nesterenkonia rhizosphaerae]|uniref:Uncharacterized protein n=1 Tax=Nesterenkonia rhizosphaerae TaxID=1348272 RepID=A0ABP9G0H7_9MICC